MLRPSVSGGILQEEGYYILNTDTNLRRGFSDTQDMKDWIRDNRTNPLLTGAVKVVNNPATITNYVNFFNTCSNIESLDLTSFSTNNVTNMSYMFGSCTSLTSINLLSFDTIKVTNMTNMFMVPMNTYAPLKSLDLSSFRFLSTQMANMFKNRILLETLYCYSYYEGIFFEYAITDLPNINVLYKNE